MTTSAIQSQTRPSGGWWAQTKRTLANSWIITRREVRDSFRDWRIIGPIVLLTFIFPFLSEFVAGQFQGFFEDNGAAIAGERTIPFLLMVVGFFPISISLVIALETFVGEKERRSLEPLLSTPLSNTELYIGKTLAAMIPPLLSSFGGMAVYLAQALSGDLAWRPPAMLIFQIMLMSIMQALVMVTGAVVVSSQTTSTRAANLLASFIIIPMSFVVIGESIIMFLAEDANSPNGIGALWAIIFGMAVVAVLFLRVGNSIFNREELLSSTLDTLNLRGMFAKIGRYIIAVDDEGTPATGIIDFYRRSIPHGLGKVKQAFMLVSSIFFLAFVVGFYMSTLPQYQIPLPTQQEIAERADGTDDERRLVETAIASEQLSVGFIFGQNARVLLATFILAVFSFGVMAAVLPSFTFVILGYLAGLLLGAGFDPALVLVGVGTHGIIEIPTITLAAAASLALGAAVTRPPKGYTVGHAWLTTFSITIRLTIGLIMPGLLIAALIESRITPYLVLDMMMGG